MATITRTITLTGMSQSAIGVTPPSTGGAAPATNTRLDFALADSAPERFIGPATITFIAEPSDGDIGALALGGQWTLTVTLTPATPAAAAS